MQSYPLYDYVVIIRGAGEMASGVAHRLHQVGFLLVLTETAHPLIRRCRTELPGGEDEEQP